MKVAILGAGGFLGSYLHKSLTAAGHDVVPVTRQTLDLGNFGIVNSWLTLSNLDVAINCAISGSASHAYDISYSNVQRDFGVFLNFFNNANTPKYINIGSGAEFDRRHSINNAQEHEILNRTPIESYGFVKNIIARTCLEKDNFYTLRLFGCFDSTESDSRLFKRTLAGKVRMVENKYFDTISAADFASIVKYYVETKEGLPKDVNCVYKEKTLLSDQLRLFVEHHAPSQKIPISNEIGLNYTGDGSILAKLPIKLQGLEQGIRNYG